MADFAIYSPLLPLRCISVPEDCFYLSKLCNSADPDEMQHSAVFHLGLHCLPKYHFQVYQYTKGSIIHATNF